MGWITTEFPFLIGRIRTHKEYCRKRLGRLFPFLIGRIRTNKAIPEDTWFKGSFHSS